MAGMWNAFSISASGLAASAAQLTNAASKLVNAFTGPAAAPAPAAAQAASASAPATPASRPLSGATAVAAQNATPNSWMVEILSAKYAYRANLDALKSADAMAQKTIDTVG
jgi:flagellar basal body rod protein FlgC